MSLWTWCPDLRDHLLLPAEGTISTSPIPVMGTTFTLSSYSSARCHCFQCKLRSLCKCSLACLCPSAAISPSSGSDCGLIFCWKFYFFVKFCSTIFFLSLRMLICKSTPLNIFFLVFIWFCVLLNYVK